MKPVICSLLTRVVVCCIVLSTCGCATLYVQPAVVQQDSVAVTVAVDEPEGANGLAIIGFPPKTIRIIPKKEGQWIKPVDVNLQKNQYQHTFDGLEAYRIDKNGLAIVFEVGKGAGPYKTKLAEQIKVTEPPTTQQPDSLKYKKLTGKIKVTEPSPIQPSDGPNYKKGYKRAVQYRNGELRAYRLVIDLHPLSSSDRNDFLQGFKSAYAQANDSELGEKCAHILKQSHAGGIYEDALEQGKKHVKGQVPDMQIQDFMRRTVGVGLSISITLGWKAGYIEGFVQGKFEPEVHDKESLYQEAETMYRVLRAGAAL